MNDYIYQWGYILKDPSIDSVSVYSTRTRKSRSYGTRKNGNIKRKARLTTSITDLHNILLQSCRHTMLSPLSSLPLSSIKDIDDQADVIIIRKDPLYKTAA